MNEQDQNSPQNDDQNDDKEMEEFWRMADAFIHLANEQCEGVEREKVSSAMVYAAARFNAFIVASNAYNEKEFNEQRQEATEFFNNQFENMLAENLDDYSDNYKQYMEVPLN